jgi:hypothetical protein
VHRRVLAGEHQLLRDELHRTPRPVSSPTSRRRSSRLRPSRSRLCTTTVSPSRTNRSSSASFGRATSLPEALSVKVRSNRRPSSCRSGFWSRVLTRTRPVHDVLERRPARTAVEYRHRGDRRAAATPLRRSRPRPAMLRRTSAPQCRVCRRSRGRCRISRGLTAEHHRGHSSPSTRAADSRRSVPHCTRVTGSAVSSARACSTAIRAAVRARRWSGSQPLTARVAAVGVE